MTILSARVGREMGGQVVVDRAAIEFCARKVSSVHGDLRKALDICRYVHCVPVWCVLFACLQFVCVCECACVRL